MKNLFLTFIIAFCFVFSAIKIAAQQHNPEKETGSIGFPENAIGKIVKEFVSTINSKDRNSINKFINQYLDDNLISVDGEPWTKDKYMLLLENLQRDGGILTPVDLRPSNTDDYMTALFSTSIADKTIGIEFIKSKTNNTLTALQFHVMSSPSKPYQWPEGKLNEKEIISAIDEKLQKDYNQGLFSGNVLVAKGDKVILEKSYGYANIEKQILNNEDTRFHTGSVGKMITATAIAQLVEQGKLNFSDTLGTILKDYPNKEAASKITIHQLLTHTSGIADPFELGRRKPGVDYSTAEANLPLFADTPLRMKPGDYHTYSNGNYAALALIVEKISGMSFEDYLRKNIFIPAGMMIANKDQYKNFPKATRYSYSVVDDPLALKPLTPVNDPSNDFEFEYSGFCNGYLTAKDIYNFLYALKSGKLVSKKMVEKITSGKVEIDKGVPVKYAYGFYDSNLWGTNFRGHSGGGGNSGIGADAEFLWDKDYYVVLLGNCDLEKVRPIEFSIIRFLGSQN